MIKGFCGMKQLKNTLRKYIRLGFLFIGLYGLFGFFTAKFEQTDYFPFLFFVTLLCLFFSVYYLVESCKLCERLINNLEFYSR